MQWSSRFAYAIGLFTADGCLSSDGRHLNFTSKDEEQILNFIKCLSLTNKIGKKAREKGKIKKYYQVQFGNKELYNFLQSIGVKPRKSLTIEKVDIPSEFFPDFLRGLFDGDGTFGEFNHPESQYPQLRLRFASASKQFIRWLHQEIKKELDTKGFIANGKGDENLTYGISDSLKLINYMYYSSNVIYLSRKFQKVEPYLRT